MESGNLHKALFVGAGILCAVLGTIGVFLPILPTVPLYLLAGIFFARGSERLSAWFESTTFYQQKVRFIREGRGMTLRDKLASFAMVTALLGFAFYMMRNTPAKWILAAVEVFHIWLFFFHLPTRPEEGSS